MPATAVIRPAARIRGFTYAIRNVVGEAKKLEAAGRTVRYLNIGDPIPFGFKTPPHLVDGLPTHLPPCLAFSSIGCAVNHAFNTSFNAQTVAVIIQPVVLFHVREHAPERFGKYVLVLIERGVHLLRKCR